MIKPNSLFNVRLSVAISAILAIAAGFPSAADAAVHFRNPQSVDLQDYSPELSVLLSQLTTRYPQQIDSQVNDFAQLIPREDADLVRALFDELRATHEFRPHL